MASYCRDRTVLDCHAYTGGFGLYASRFGAAQVTSVESSESACGLMEKNFSLNRAKNSILREDVEGVLTRFQKENRKFDIIVLDPPALAKSKMNELALSVLSPEGVLFSSSCSHHVGRAEFIGTLRAAGASRNRGIRILEMRGASRDHPVLPSMPETEYLKCAILRVE
jgi:23S rRNA (cytosine1962-C5)-methyltransferase